MMPLNRQVIYAMLACGGAEDEDDEDDEEDPILDMSTLMRQMIGPDGTCFGRNWLDLRLLIADALETSGGSERALRSIIESALAGRAPKIVITMADGSTSPVNGPKWRCAEKDKATQN